MVDIENKAITRAWRRCAGIAMCAILVAMGLMAGAAEAHAEEESSLATIPSPFAMTGEAGGVTASKAILWGDVYPGGKVEIDTKYRFEYGTTTSYGSYGAEGNAGSELVGKTVSTEIKSLTSGATYHYRIVAWNSKGTYYGGDRTFTIERSAPKSSTWALAAQSVADINAFYTNTSSQLANEYWTPASNWTNQTLAEGINSTSAATEDAESNNMNLFYENTSGQLVNEYWTTSGGWKNQTLAGGMGGAPAAAENGAGNNTNVFYRNTGGQLVNEYWTTSGGWTSQTLAEGVSGVPAAVENT
jgi:hypothetical protein